MTVVLIARNGHRMMLNIEKPELCIRVKNTRSHVDYDLHSVDHQSRMVYVERKPEKVTT